MPILLLLMSHLPVDVTYPDTYKWQCAHFYLGKHCPHRVALIYKTVFVYICTDDVGIVKIEFYVVPEDLTLCRQVFVVSTVSRHEMSCAHSKIIVPQWLHCWPRNLSRANWRNATYRMLSDNLRILNGGDQKQICRKGSE